MTDRAFLKTFSGLLAALAALTVVIFVVAQMVTGANKTKAAQTADRQVAARIQAGRRAGDGRRQPRSPTA
ncbi:MAG: hypothetical protein MZV65_54335 [Chromatiales bacterium]|nr:hypothetical protein [Chromatiales bacterium]